MSAKPTVLLLLALCAAQTWSAPNCNTRPTYAPASLQVRPGAALALEGHFGDAPVGRVFLLQASRDGWFSDPQPGPAVDLQTLEWSARRVTVRIPPDAGPGHYSLDVRCTEPWAEAPTLNWRQTLRVQGDPDSLWEQTQLALEAHPQLRMPWSPVMFAGYLGFVLLFALPILGNALRTPLSPGGVAGAAGSFALAATFWIAWWNPARLGGEMVVYLVYLMVAEFVLMHASVFLASLAETPMDPKQRLLAMGGLGLLYSLFAGAISFAAKSAWPFVMLWAVILLRFVPAALRGPGAGPPQGYMVRAASSSAVYILGAAFCLFYPLPMLGAVGSLSAHGEGIWMDEPHRPLAFGVFYFLMLGLIELTSQSSPSPAATGGDDGNR